MHVMMVAVMAEQRRGRACRRWHLVHVQRALLVLGLGTAQCRLQRHHALPVRGEAALLAGAVAVLAVPLVTLQRDLQSVVATSRTIRWRARRNGAAAGAGGAAAHVVLRVDHVRVGHGVAVPVLLGNHASNRSLSVSLSPFLSLCLTVKLPRLLNSLLWA